MDDLIREMITPPRRSSLDSSRRSRLVATTLTVGLACVGVTSLTTGALFTDTETMSSSDFTTGTVVIDPQMSPTVELGSGNMAPGDTTYGSILVNNTGSLEQRYAISLAATNDQPTALTGELGLTLFGGVAEGSCNAAGVVGLTPIGARTSLPLTSTPLTGSTTPGQYPGSGTPGINDADRVLGALTSERLCVAVHLPIVTGNAFQGTTAHLALTFDAEQTANNA